MTDASTTTKASTKTAPKAAAAPAPESKAVELLQRVIFPRPGEPLDVRSLYLVEADGNQRRAHSPSRTSVVIGGESEVSFETYFNAFAAAYWRRWTTLTSVVLRVELTGTARVDLYRSKIDGSRIGIGGDLVPVDEQGRGVIEFELDLGPFEDGGWIWFDITTDTDTEITSAGWYSAVASPNPDATVTVGIPTFNRPTDAVAALAALSSDPLVDAVIDAVIMPDQGTRRVVDEPGFDEAAAALGDRLHMFKQGNLGGSGGYSRIMYEALRLTDSPYVLYMDDDIAIEPDSILRALAMSRFAKTPMLVGGQMLNLQDRSHLHCMGEVINRHTFMWTAAPFVEYDHDFSKYPMSDRDNSKNLHRRIDVEGNGWWMCMIPRECAETIGLPMPLFIKWDDWEFALRAAKAGYPTATVPGIAIWHMAWSDKDDAIDWQAYFHLRNRLVVAALHWDGDVRGLIASHFKATVKHLLCLEYSTVAIQNQAMDDFLAGPEHIFSILESALPDVHALRKEFPDAVVLPGATSLPVPSARKRVHKPPVRLPAIGFRLARGIAHQLREADPEHHVRPELNVATQDARWFLLCNVDGVTVTTADGRGVVYRQRDRAKMFGLLRESLRRQVKLYRKFNTMRRVYREALPQLTSTLRWEAVLLEQNSLTNG